ncbi:MAG: acyl-CoA/acyl-ACP dehydrogenase [Gammaproteobacteria bacterium]|nr:acyl-CoA/acyl-ACP dehydrogenase [Gammaproteobacteria bacterium]
MEFGLSEEQRMLADSIRRFADERVDGERLKALVDGGDSANVDLLRGLADLGALGILTPEEHGGSGMTLLDACLVQQALGRNAVPIPFTASAILAPLAFAASPGDAGAEWLPALAGGVRRIGVGLSEAAGRRSGAGVKARSGKASGVARFVIDGQGADAWILATDEGGLILVEAGATGVQTVALTTIDRSRGVLEIRLDDSPCTTLLAADPAVAARLLAAGRVALAFDSLGAAERMLERAVAYAMERKQFGRVIASFQAVKHLCAEMAAEIEPCHSLLWYAAYAAEAYPDEFELMACHAKAHMGEVGQFVARTATEVHGGMGFTHEMGLHYFFKRIGLNRQLLGNPDQVRQHAAALQGWQRSAAAR